MMQGILLLNKPATKTSFFLVSCLRKIFNERKIGHAGTLDPFATGVMVMLIGKPFTRISNSFLEQDKEYTGQLRLGISTDSYDCTGKVVRTSDILPSEESLEKALSYFQGEIEQIPPMFSAKKINGQKLYDLARKGKIIERKPQTVKVNTTLLNYQYPFVDFKVTCSKGTYIRSIAHDPGEQLGCGGHLNQLTRTRSGSFHLNDCFSLDFFSDPQFDMNILIKDEKGLIQRCKSSTS